MQSESTYIPLVVLSKESRDLINDFSPNFSDESLRKALKDNDGQLRFSVIRHLAKEIKEMTNGPHLCDLLRGSQIELPAPVQLPRNPELELRLEKLQNQSNNKEYVTMTKNVDLTYQASHMNEFRSEMQEVRGQLMAVVNFVITVIACFLFGYKAVEYTLPTPNIAAQVLVGIVIASFGALADLYFLAKQIEKTTS